MKKIVIFLCLIILLLFANWLTRKIFSNWKKLNNVVSIDISSLAGNLETREAIFKINSNDKKEILKFKAYCNETEILELNTSAIGAHYSAWINGDVIYNFLCKNQ